MPARQENLSAQGMFRLFREYQSRSGITSRTALNRKQYNSLNRSIKLLFSSTQRLIKVYHTLYFLEAVGGLLKLRTEQ